MVNTVLGECLPSDLGLTLIHEHLLIGLPGHEFDATISQFNRDIAIENGIALFSELKALGLNTWVDPVPSDFGRNVKIMAEVSRQSGIRIICSTGIAVENMYFSYMNSKRISEVYTSEILNGINGTEIKPGIIKVLTHYPILPEEEKYIRAAGIASASTGVPIITHTDNASGGNEQWKIFHSEGVPAANVIIGHSDGRADLQYHIELLEQGVNLSFDRFGQEIYISDKLRMMTLMALISAGYEKQIFISHDSVCTWLGKETGLPKSGTGLQKNWKPQHLFNNIIPALKNAGVHEKTIKTMLIENPRQLFSTK